MTDLRLLQPLRWHLADPPPHPAWPEGADPPLLLLIDRRPALPPPVWEALQASLSQDERQRLAALRRPGDRQRFLLARGALRALLAAALGQEAGAVTLQRDGRGKPLCPGGPAFNLSHSGDLILLGVHACRPVGVDVERQRAELAWEPLARRCLPADELERLLQLLPAEQPHAFLAAWCRLEARLKARGTGLAGLEALRRDDSDRGTSLWPVCVPDGYAAAAALELPPPAEPQQDGRRRGS